ANGAPAGAPSSADPAKRGTAGRVYAIGSDGEPRAVALRLGIGDGRMTEVLAGGLVPGQQVVVGVEGAGTGSAPARRGPF
ncbi:MAG: hypothetical protein H0W48_14535, partial [Methylibium sp.]|nr:hypothetical protein [Methylibium sp.]